MKWISSAGESWSRIERQEVLSIPVYRPQAASLPGSASASLFSSSPLTFFILVIASAPQPVAA